MLIDKHAAATLTPKGFRGRTCELGTGRSVFDVLGDTGDARHSCNHEALHFFVAIHCFTRVASVIIVVIKASLDLPLEHPPGAAIKDPSSLPLDQLKRDSDSLIEAMRRSDP